MPPDAAQPRHSERFFINVLWNWLAVGVNLFIGFYLTRYMIGKLTDEQYGVWILAFSLVEYITLADLGFRTAVVNFLSRLRVQKDAQGMSEVVSTSLAYFMVIASAAILLAVMLAGQGYRAFKISPAYRSDFSFLLMIVGFIWAGAVVSAIFQASLEAFQAFKACNKIVVGTILIRSICCVVVLRLGYGLRMLGICTLVAQLAGWALLFMTFRRMLPELKLGRAFVRWQRWKEMARYGFNSVFANTGTLLLNQGPPLVVGHYLPATFVGYYGLPFRLLTYMVDLIQRIGFVTAPKTAELWALGKRAEIGLFGARLNRYCFALFLPVSIFLAVYGRPLLTKWLVRPEFVNQCAPLLPVFTLSVSLAVAAQFNSSSMLFGMAKHGPFAISVIAESILALGGMALILPHYGIFGAACVSAGLTIMNRGFITPLIVCRQLPYSYFHYMVSIYLRPLLCGAPVLVLAMWLKSSWLPGQTVVQLMVAGGLLISIGLLAGLVFCVEPEHRDLLRNLLLQRLGKGREPVAEPDPQLL